MSQQINLYDPSLLRRNELLSATNLALVSIVWLVIVVAMGAWSRVTAARLEAEAAVTGPQVKALRDQLTALGQAALTRKPDASVARELGEANAQLATRIEILAMLRKGLGPEAASFAEYLRGFARQTPAGLWLTGFAVDGDGAGMEIQGRTIDPALIPEYIRRLNGEKAFQGRAFSALQLSVPAQPADAAVSSAANVAATGQVPPPPRYHLFSLTPAQVAGVATAAGVGGNGTSPVSEGRR